jgi:peroxiredoxin Q/BCP
MPRRAENSTSADLALASRIRLCDQHGISRQLSDFLGRNLVLYFYPKDDTPGCTVEGKEFRDLYDEFVALDAVIIGVSTDTVESHRKFAEKHALPFPLLADTNGELSRAFDVLRGAMASRVTFVLGPDGRIVRVFPDVAPRGHAREVLNFIRALQESHRMLGG